MLDEEIMSVVDGEEIWVKVEDFPQYMISNLGNIHHVDRISPRNLSINHQGFPVLTLWRENNPTRYLRQVNQLVAQAFLPPPEQHPKYPLNSVWHIDGNFLICSADNLKWDRRDRVLEWNDMQRSGEPKCRTPKVMDNRTGIIYENAYEAGMATGEIETAVIGHIEKYPEMYADKAKYRYV